MRLNLFPNNKKIDFWEIEYSNIFRGGGCDEINRTFKLFANTNLHDNIEMQKAKELLEKSNWEINPVLL